MAHESGSPRTISSIGLDRIWVYEQWERLCKMHPNHVIAVYEQQIVAVAPSFGDLANKLKSDGFTVANVVMEYMNADADFVQRFISQRASKIEAIRNGDVMG